MNVVLDRNAAKELERTNEPLKSRIIEALNGLRNEPPQGDIKKLQGKDGYRRRVGSYRIVFDITETEVIVYKIAPRGQAYKGG